MSLINVCIKHVHSELNLKIINLLEDILYRLHIIKDKTHSVILNESERNYLQHNFQIRKILI